MPLNTEPQRYFSKIILQLIKDDKEFRRDLMNELEQYLLDQESMIEAQSTVQSI
jgi:hypothetical protein